MWANFAHLNPDPVGRIWITIKVMSWIWIRIKLPKMVQIHADFVP
jgi:hypothetical protein